MKSKEFKITFFLILFLLFMSSAVPVKDKSGILLHITSPSKTIISFATDGKDTIFTTGDNPELQFVWIPHAGMWKAVAISPGYIQAVDSCNCELGFFEDVYLTIDTPFVKKKDD